MIPWPFLILRSIIDGPIVIFTFLSLRPPSFQVLESLYVKFAEVSIFLDILYVSYHFFSLFIEIVKDVLEDFSH